MSVAKNSNVTDIVHYNIFMVFTLSLNFRQDARLIQKCEFVSSLQKRITQIFSLLHNRIFNTQTATVIFTLGLLYHLFVLSDNGLPISVQKVKCILKPIK